MLVATSRYCDTMVANVFYVMHNARFTHAFSAGIKCLYCVISSISVYYMNRVYRRLLPVVGCLGSFSTLDKGQSPRCVAIFKLVIFALKVHTCCTFIYIATVVCELRLGTHYAVHLQ